MAFFPSSYRHLKTLLRQKVQRTILPLFCILHCLATLPLKAELSTEHQEQLEVLLEAYCTATPFDVHNDTLINNYIRDNDLDSRYVKQFKQQWGIENWKRIWNIRINAIEDTPVESSLDPWIASGKELPSEFVENDMWIRFYTQNRMNLDELNFSTDEMALMSLLGTIARAGALDELPGHLQLYSNSLPPTHRDVAIGRVSNWILTMMGPSVGYDNFTGTSPLVWKSLVHSKNPIYRCIALNGINQSIPKHLQHYYTPWPSKKKRAIHYLSAYFKYELYKLYFEEESELIQQALYSCISGLPIPDPLTFLKSELVRRSIELPIKEIEKTVVLQSENYDPFAPARPTVRKTIKVHPKLYAVKRLAETISRLEPGIRSIPEEYKERILQSKLDAKIYLKGASESP